MHTRHKALAAALVLGSAFAALAPATALGAVQEPAAQNEPPRRPQGPAAGPVIKLPRSETLGDERTPQQPASARDERPAAPQKWEYCSIIGFVYRQKGFSVSAPHVATAVIRYFGGTTEEVDGPSTSEDEALAAAFAKLGEDGWELAGLRTDLSLSDGRGTASTVYFFKRPKKRE